MEAQRLEENDLQRQGIYSLPKSRSFPLLRTKLTVPPIHPAAISRPRLVNQLNGGTKFKVTLISAPIGSGKTALLSEWVHQSAQPVIWLSLSERDNNPVHFWTYLHVALASLFEYTIASALESWLPDSQEILLADIANLLDTISQEFVLILDNYHTIQNPLIHEALIELLEYTYTKMHLFIASRTCPPLPLARLRAYRQLYELSLVDLFFTNDEIETFLTQMLRQKFPQWQIEAIKMRTEGWIAILNLIVILLQKQSGNWESLERIPDTQHYILEYLLEEVLRRQPLNVQSFLLQTSILAQFNSSLCDALTGNTDSYQLLEQIGQANLFLTILSKKSDWYSYYQFFRNFLRERLAQVSPDQIPLLHRRACIWYKKQGMYEEAIAHALVIEGFEKSTRPLFDNDEKSGMSGDVDPLFIWLKTLPEKLVSQHPLLNHLRAWNLIMADQFTIAENMLPADCGITITSMMQGKCLSTISQQTLQLIERYTNYKNYLLPFTELLYIEASYLLYEWNRLDEATYYVCEALIDKHQKNPCIRVYGYATLSRIKMAQGNLNDAYKLLLLIEEDILHSQCCPWISTRVAEQSVNLTLARQEIRQAEYWSRWPVLKQFGSLATILPMRVLLAKKQPYEALDLAHTYLLSSEKETEDLMFVLLQACAYQEIGNESQALHLLDCALQKAEPEGYIRMFLDQGPLIAHMLSCQLTYYEAQCDTIYGDTANTKLIRYINLLLSEFTKEAEKYTPHIRQLVSLSTQADLPHALSERELSVLQGIATGFSNQEIAQKIVVAESTVKWHIKNIYGKLGVHNRTKAIIEAKKLHLI